MVCDRKRLACAGVEYFATEFVFNRQETVFAQHSVDMDRSIHLRDAVFGEQNYLHHPFLEKVNQLTDDRVDQSQIFRDVGMLRAETLQVVVKVREINETEA